MEQVTMKQEEFKTAIYSAYQKGVRDMVGAIFTSSVAVIAISLSYEYLAKPAFAKLKTKTQKKKIIDVESKLVDDEK